MDNLMFFLDSEDPEIYGNHITEKMENEYKIRKSQIDRFHNKFGNKDMFKVIVDKILNKYYSDSYRDRWYSRNIEPPEDLLFFLFDYAKIYGRQCNTDEWHKHSNMFTFDLVKLNDYYFNLMCGQGTVINIIYDGTEN